jgi:hypothetical protein
MLPEFREVWAVDFEFRAPPGDRPSPVCLVARELRSGAELRVWEDELRRRETPPYPIDEGALFVAYYASAELSCHLALGWPLPSRVLDLYVEFRNLTNGLPVPCGSGLLGALAYYGLPAIDAAEKDSMRELVLRGGPWTPTERARLLDYCASDVHSLQRLSVPMLEAIDLPRALLRGRYMVAAARIEHAGVPIDVEALRELRASWDDIREALIDEIDADYGVFANHAFNESRFEEWLDRKGIPWLRHASGRLTLDDDSWREAARAFPELEPLRQLRSTLAQMRLADLAVGADGRNRVLLSAFRARTGRNQPSNSQFVFGTASWLRGLVRPTPGNALAYVDWEQQEFGIAAALSGDAAMLAAYRSGDPYLAFAQQAGAVAVGATKQTHGDVREQFKQCALAVQYGMGAASLGRKIGQTTARADELLRLHRRTYPKFWAWSDAAVDHGMLHGSLYTTFGWTLHVDENANPRSLRNFPMQANGAEMLRLACCLATERGVQVCAPVHDALLIEECADQIDASVDSTRAAMAEASRVILNGFELRTDVKCIEHPSRLLETRGERMWRTVWDLIGRHKPVRDRNLDCAQTHTRSISSRGSSCERRS